MDEEYNNPLLTLEELAIIKMGVRGRIGDKVYQTTSEFYGNVTGDDTHTLQIRKYTPNNTSNSPAQAIQREKMRNAVSAYRLLSPEEIAQYKAQGSKKNRNSFIEFISEYMRARPTPQPPVYPPDPDDPGAGAYYE
jgi:hypothetical protein